MTPTTSKHQPGRISPGLMLALGFVSMAASLATDLYLPSFPSIGASFGVGASTVQFTLTAFMIGIAIGNLLVGSLSDALGRRTILIIGLSIYTLGGLAAVFSPSIEVLIAVRAVQGFGAASGAVLARAIVSDLAPPQESARAFSFLFMMIGIGPMVANPLGAVLTQFGGWRMPLTALGVIATVMLVVAIWRVPESLVPEKRQPFNIGGLARNLLRLSRTPSFMGFTVAFGAGYAAMMVYISSSSFIVQDFFGLGPVGYSLTFAAGSGAFIVGAWVSGRIAPNIGGAGTLLRGQTVQLLAAVTLMVLAVTGVLSLWAYVPLVMLLCAGSGMLMSTASALAIGQAVGIAGAGSALVGFSQFVFGASSTPLGGLFGTGTVVPAAVAMAAFSVVSLTASLLARRWVARGK